MKLENFWDVPQLLHVCITSTFETKAKNIKGSRTTRKKLFGSIIIISKGVIIKIIRARWKIWHESSQSEGYNPRLCVLDELLLLVEQTIQFAVTFHGTCKRWSIGFLLSSSYVEVRCFTLAENWVMIADIICITQITFKYINNALCVNNGCSCAFPRLKKISQLNAYLCHVFRVALTQRNGWLYYRFNQEYQGWGKAPHNPWVYIKLPFKDQRSANRVRKEIKSHGSQMDVNIQLVLSSKKLSQILSQRNQASDCQHIRCRLHLWMRFVLCKLCRPNYPALNQRFR